MQNTLRAHYAQLLGLTADWDVRDVKLDVEKKGVEIAVAWRKGRKVSCPECGTACTVADHAPERRWRHLDTMQFTTEIRARTPRADCPSCGVKTTSVPWAGKHSRFTLLFEAFVVEVLLMSRDVGAAGKLLGLSWSSVQKIMDRAVERGLDRRELEGLDYVGIDEKSFGRGQDYISVLTDLSQSRVLDVEAGRDEAAAGALWAAVPEPQRQGIAAVAMDMWPAYMNATRRAVPQAEIVHDRFHISKHLNEGLDQVRRAEHKALRQKGENTLTGTRQLWLFNPENMSDPQWMRFHHLKDADLKTSRAWLIKEDFSWFWNYRYAGNAKKFFDDWYAWAVRSRLRPMVRVAKMIKRHLPELLSYFRHRITNAVAEGFNSRIHAIKSAARGFRSAANYRTRILFFCGKLDMLPAGLTH
jgi:transposase